MPLEEISGLPPFFCELCKVMTSSVESYKQHVRGKSHRKKSLVQLTTLANSRTPLECFPPTAGFEDDNTENPEVVCIGSSVHYRCTLCNVLSSGPQHHAVHCAGSRHIRQKLLSKRFKAPADHPAVVSPSTSASDFLSLYSGNSSNPAVPAEKSDRSCPHTEASRFESKSEAAKTSLVSLTSPVRGELDQVRISSSNQLSDCDIR